MKLSFVRWTELYLFFLFSFFGAALPEHREREREKKKKLPLIIHKALFMNQIKNGY